MRARSVNSQLFKAKVFPNETQRICRSIDEFRNGSPCTVPSTGLDPDERRTSPALATLEPRSEFVGVSWYNPVVVVSRCDECCRIARPRLEPVQRRIPEKVLEMLWGFRATKFAHPSPPDGELVEPQHVHHPYGRQSHRE